MMKKIYFSLFMGVILCTGFACGGNTTSDTEEGKTPVSAEDPKAPTTAPEEPSTDINRGLEDTVRHTEETQDTLKL